MHNGCEKKTKYYWMMRCFALLVVILCATVRVSADVEAVYLTPHFHYDPVFEKDQRAYTSVGFDRCRRFLKALKEDPDYHVVFTEIDYLKPFFDLFPEEREMILKLVADNRIETGGSYSEPNEMSVGGEGLIRNILYGRAYHEGVLGDQRAGVYMPFDVFGHTIQLTQILAKSRYAGAAWRKGNPAIGSNPEITVPGLPPDFIDLAPDGSTLHHRREHYKSYSAASYEELIGKVAKKKRLQDSLGLAADFGLLSSADFAYPEPWLSGKSTSLKSNQPPILISGPTAYFEAIDRQLKAGKAMMPLISRDFSLYHVGTALSRVDLKIANRLAENALLSAEKFGVAAAMLGAIYPEPALDKAWRQLLFNQHHDGITGTCNDLSFFDMMEGFREAVTLGGGALSGAEYFIASKIDTGKIKGAVPIVVFNPLGWKRTDTVSLIVDNTPEGPFVLTDANENSIQFDMSNVMIGGLEKSRLIFVASDVPPVGYKTFFIKNGEGMKSDAAALSAKDNTIENEYYIVTVDPARGGAITKLVDKQTGRVVIDPSTKYPGNELIVLKEDQGPQYPAWELSTVGVKGYSSDNKADVETITGVSFVKLVVKGRIGDLGVYTQEIRLSAGVKRIDMMTTILPENLLKDASNRNMWMVRFPVKLNGTGPVIEDRFYAAARRESLKPLNYRTDLDKMLTLSAPYSALNWVEEGTAVRVDIADASGALSDGLAVRLCEIVHARNAESIAAAQTLESALIMRGVTCTPSYADEDRNKDLLNRNFRFVIAIGSDNAFAASVTSKGESGAKYKERLATEGAARLLISPVANDMEIRNVDTLVLGAADAARMKKMMSQLAEEITQKMRIALSVEEDGRNSKKKAPPDDYGIALINRGNILHSFDSNGTVVMGLFHSAQWAAELQGIPFTITEAKTHRYEYALYPHSGDWRRAQTYRVGHEVNTPLTAVEAKTQDGNLPVVMSFIDIESDSAVLSSVKAAGNPYASMKTSGATGPRNGVMIRFYEAEGKATDVRVKFFKPLKSARHTNLIEEPDGGTVRLLYGDTIEMKLGPNAIETVLVEFKEEGELSAASQAIAAATEQSKRLYSDYWALNLGAAYMYNSPVSVSIGYPLEKNLPESGMLGVNVRKQPKNTLKKGNNKMRLAVSNNSTDSPLEGTLTIEAPDGLTPSFTEKKQTFAAREGRIVDFEVRADSPPAGGYIRASLKAGDKTYFGTLPVGKHDDLAASAAIEKAIGNCRKLKVDISNNQGGDIEGAVSVIGPVETFPEIAAAPLSLTDVFPSAVDFELAGNQSGVYMFDFCGIEKGAENIQSWLMIKIRYNGELKYIPLEIN
ncbi:MAG: glycosyl hydrolase-related protein [bacterium]